MDLNIAYLLIPGNLIPLNMLCRKLSELFGRFLFGASGQSSQNSGLFRFCPAVKVSPYLFDRIELIRRILLQLSFAFIRLLLENRGSKESI